MPARHRAHGKTCNKKITIKKCKMTTDRKHDYEKTQWNHKVMNYDHHKKQNDHKETKDINHKEREKDLIHSQKKNKMMGCGVFTCLCRGALCLIIPYSQIFFLYLCTFNFTSSAQPQMINVCCQPKFNHRFWSLFAFLYKCTFVNCIYCCGVKKVGII